MTNPYCSWRTIRKARTSLHLGYRKGFTHNLSAGEVRLRVTDRLELEIELGHNLHARNKSTNTVEDARALAAGALFDLLELQADRVLLTADVRQAARQSPATDGLWRLRLNLDEGWVFLARPASADEASLYFEIVGRELPV